MAWFLYFISTAWIAIGACAILYTAQTRQAAKTLLLKTHRPILACLPFIAGILFVFSAASSSHPWIIRLFGIVGLLKGVVVYVNPGNFYTTSIDWYLDALSDQAHRFLGIIIVILGTALLSWVN